MKRVLYKCLRLFLILLICFVLPPVTANASSPSKIYYQNRVAVLMYHHIDPAEYDITITPERFQQHMDSLRDHGFQVINLHEFEDFVKYNDPVPPNAVLITFDDGYESFYKYAYPILLDHGFTATNFIIVKNAENYNVDPEFPYLSFDEMREMMKSGMSFQSHTYDQHWQDNLLLGPIYLDGQQRMETQEEYETRVSSDLRLAKKRLKEELGVKQNMFAFPHGDYNQSLIDIGRKAGIDLFFTGDTGLTAPGNALIYRIPAGLAYITGSDLIRRIERAERTVNANQAFPFLAPKITINGAQQDSDQPPILMNGQSLVPLRLIAQAMGAELGWNQQDGFIHLTKGSLSIMLQADSNIAQVNGKKETLDAPVQDVNNHSMISTRWIVEKLGGKVGWSEEENAIEISTADFLKQ